MSSKLQAGSDMIMKYAVLRFGGYLQGHLVPLSNFPRKARKSDGEARRCKIVTTSSFVQLPHRLV